jgi:hypothetical protein
VPGRHPPVTLRVEPHALPAIRAAFDEAISEVARAVHRLRTEAFIPESWLGDKVSAAVRQHYNLRVMEADDGPYAAFRAYEAELIKIHDSLKAMEDHYSRTEGDNTALWGKA